MPKHFTLQQPITQQLAIAAIQALSVDQRQWLIHDVDSTNPGSTEIQYLMSHPDETCLRQRYKTTGAVQFL
ncbi:uncharacterized protein RCC_11221 [Ramularia collo-cygni]|uniref:Uncharacterized protein n=1 Tax=Ramularia collo-cygni TaxID=112498 RepID=A0A2D3VND9_9PEZI|nr:uncharacterized protein RCC_11221 [Ramularia collo-cygni]CZT25489.1 uncharacterized protein RCC_11221 [Ramularia collo-cygni]